MNEANDFSKKLLDKVIENAVYTVHNKYLGNYTTSYNTWKRIEGIKALFQREAKQREGCCLNILDIGCGDALPLFIINSHNTNKSLRFHGIDISVIDVFFAERLKRKIGINNFTFYVGDGECLPFNNRVFDIVICSEMLEHIKEPENCLKEIKRVLKDDGVCFVSTPNRDNSVTRLKSFFKKADKKTLEGREILNREEHISVRGLKVWKRVFSSMGFTVEAIKRHGIIYGGYRYNKYRLLFAFLMIADFIFGYLPFMQNFSEGITYKLKIYKRHEK